MSKLLKKISILAGIFVAAAGIYFVLAQNTIQKDDTVYTSMEEAALPVVYTDVLGLEFNMLPGYLQEMDQITARDALTVLPEDRLLNLRVEGGGESALSIQYEIRSLDLDRLVERTEISDWSTQDGTISATLPIQNLLTRGTEYLLHITMKTERYEAIHYYTRILLPKEAYAQDMLHFARDFSEKTLDSEQAQSLVTYLETNSAEDNSSLGTVTIRSSFSQLTWAGLSMELVGEMQVTLKELDGIMGQIQVKYQLTREAEDGSTELYDVVDHYTLKWNTQRIYLMDFDRKTNQVFSGGRELHSGKRILLGVGNLEDIQVKYSAGKQYVSYVFNKDLWSYDQKEGNAVKIFSFRSGTDDSGRSDYDRHDIQVLSAKDNGDVDFLVYGYMNRGKHEGHVGVSLYRYEHAGGTIAEKFFVPVKMTYESLKQDLEELTYLNSTDMLYLMIDSAIYGIDLNSNEYMVVADALREGSYAISQDMHRLAWQEGTSLYQADKIHLLNLETGQKEEIASPDDSYLRTLGFVMDDFVYGLAHPDDLWTIHGRVESLPMYSLKIVDENLVEETKYEKPGVYLSEVDVEDARVHMKRLSKTGDGQYAAEEDDTIVCNAAQELSTLEGIGWYASETRRKLYFVQLGSDIKSSKTIKISVPKKVTYDASDVLTLKSNQQVQDMVFYAYGQGRLQGSSTDFSEAVQMAHQAMGIVVDADQRILWDRVNRETSKTIREPQVAVSGITKHLGEFTDDKDFGDGMLILDSRGCTLNQMLYFVDRGKPVVAYVEGETYVLLYGYDQYNVSLYNPETGQSYKMGLNDAAIYFERLRNDFISGVAVE